MLFAWLLGTAMCDAQERRCSLLGLGHDGTAMCDVQERRCSLLDLGHRRSGDALCLILGGCGLRELCSNSVG